MNSVIYADKAVQAPIVNNNNDWTSNYTRAYKLHNLVIIVVTIQGAPARNKIITTGLPAPVGNRAIEVFLGSPASLAEITTDGKLRISSPGTYDSIYIGQTIAYLTDS